MARCWKNLASAMAIYGADQRLKFFNTAFAQLWAVDEDWLEDRAGLRRSPGDAARKTPAPEYVDFPAFKRERLKLFTSLLEPLEELIYIPDGTTLHSRVAPHPMGGLLFTFDDVTDRLSPRAFLQHLDRGAARNPRSSL